MDSGPQLEQVDLERLNDKHKAELREFINHEQQRTKIQGQTHNLTNICWKRCVGAIKGKDLDKNEQTCLANCVDRFFDVNLATMRHLQSLRQANLS